MDRSSEIREEIIVGPDVNGQRLDAFLAHVLVDKFSRTKIKKMVEEGGIKVDGRTVPAHYHIKEGEKIEVEGTIAEESETRAEDIPITIVYEDDTVLVVDKPAGMVVHPAHGNLRHTLVNALLYHTQQLSSSGGNIRPGIVHRLDKDTSGILVVAKNDIAHAALANQFKQHTIARTYHAVVKGIVQHDEGVVEEPVGRAFLNRKKVIVRPSGGKDAVTFFKVVKRFGKATFLKIEPKTGRTHQIRVHMAHMGHPVLGDALYGVPSPWIQRQALHASNLAFDHPRTHERLSFESALPQDMKDLILRLESEN
ncbi:MAG: RluA family pseudouridine synthase [Candidatus Omnitrophica bacterium]|nr:RluA family pseudouridine synthase [Candidatus Omnitrophota bacterium]